MRLCTPSTLSILSFIRNLSMIARTISLIQRTLRKNKMPFLSDTILLPFTTLNQLTSQILLLIIASKEKILKMLIF